MQKLNLGTRVEMFSICASIEYDLKNCNYSEPYKQKESIEDAVLRMWF
jgi:hypothetical protein